MSAFKQQQKNSIRMPTKIKENPRESLSCIAFELNDIEKTLKKLDPKKFNDKDVLSICMLKLCGEFNYQTFEASFQVFI